MKIYIYGIIDSKDELNDSIKGLEGAPVFNIPYHDIGVVASELNGKICPQAKDSGEVVNPDCVLEHEWVIERLMKNFTVLPARFFTVFNKKEDILSMMKDYYSDFRKNLDRLRNKVEFGIKVIWPGEAIRKRIVDAYTKSSHNVLASADSPGKRFIKDRFKNYKIEEEFEGEANRYIAVVDKFFSGVASEKKLEKLRSDNLLLSASYLVEKKRQDDFKQAFERLRSAQGSLKYLFSGPWPPYNFIVLAKKSNRM